ncbi:LLM class flavin-dependent oxidoreductase [Cellulomonas fimi]|uniref:LLM class flavin-dependent oxidoreductase n=1 Tax=Cellulomonas fimi TaxID=1708 RepID=A0A7Y0QHN1_CELFI|nr:LLM class flavin-dependent oxidoreductase [Cellulomonas fimi]NMR20054.1 LLM class flavin-dependent oxidoreductase [Cellulomonas fimi]
MDYGHPLLLGTFLTPTNDRPQAPVELARLSEDLDYDLVTFQDHPDQPRFHDAWTLLSWVAARTTRIHLAPNVLNVPMRPPAVLARAAASLDLMSRGRVELALGAGFFWDAMAGMGVPRLTAGESVDALREAIDVMRGIWAGDAGSRLRLDGEHHRLAGAAGGPAPAHNIPVWVGGGRPRMLRLIGETADGWVVPGGTASLRELAAGNDRIDAAAAAAGRDPREIRRIANVSGRFADTRDGFLVGPAGQWVDELLPLVVRDGVGTLVLATDDAEVLRRFAAEVAPALRAAVDAERSTAGTAVGSVPSIHVRVRRRDGVDYAGIPAGLREAAVEPGDAVYPTVRSGYLRGGSPGLVLRVHDAAEVADALAFARRQPVPLSVRSGGHGISGRSTNDGGIIIDLSRMNRIEVLDATSRTVRIEPGARWGDVAESLHPLGWALSSGDHGGVGVGGLGVAGGIGFLGRRHGLTIDHLRAAELVLADGTAVRVSETENPDLFWAVRGAGFSVGIVTAFEFQADEVGDVGFAQLVHDATDTADFLQRWGAAVEAAPRDLTSFLIIGRPREGRVLAQTMTVVDSDDAETILARLQPLANLAPLLGQQVRITPYAGVVTAPEGAHEGQGEPVSRSGLLEHLTPGFAQDAARLVASGAAYWFQVRAMGGATGDVDPDATAFAHRSANFQVVAMGASPARLDAAWDAMRRHFTGLYVSFETDTRPERLLDAYPPRTLARLRDVKRRYDPENVFRDNVVVEPSAGTPSAGTPSAGVELRAAVPRTGAVTRAVVERGASATMPE